MKHATLAIALTLAACGSVDGTPPPNDAAADVDAELVDAAADVVDDTCLPAKQQCGDL